MPFRIGDALYRGLGGGQSKTRMGTNVALRQYRAMARNLRRLDQPTARRKFAWCAEAAHAAVRCADVSSCDAIQLTAAPQGASSVANQWQNWTHDPNSDPFDLFIAL